ncbi:prion-inhibition and propagation-domain-containing protein [Flagelloscypha sp. PMI_526]|nr:prion-inhibition and propagation-domain-containing protein [Flagelloscypha sp. PMI_526]
MTASPPHFAPYKSCLKVLMQKWKSRVLVVNVVTIQLIWKTCLFAIDKVEASQRYDVDVETLLVKLYVERVRLYQWGDALGYTANGSELERYAPDPHVAQAMNGLLTCIKRRLEDSTVLQQKYGVALEEGSHDPSPSRMHDTHSTWSS